MSTTESTTPEEIPAPEGDYEDDFYDLAYYINDDEGDELQGHDFWKAQEAVDCATSHNEIHGTNRYRAVKVRRRVEFRPVRETDR